MKNPKSPTFPIQLLSFDIDHTLLESTVSPSPFTKLWEAYYVQNMDHDRGNRSRKIKKDDSFNVKFEAKPILVYNTGRMLEDTLDLIKNHLLPEPRYIICGVGTIIYDFNLRKPIDSFSRELNEGWKKNVVEEVMNGLKTRLNLQLQPDEFQNIYKSSWFLKDAKETDIELIQNELKIRPISDDEFSSNVYLDVNVIYSSDLHLDILPKMANKGNALGWLLKELKISSENVLVAGDSGNDSAMFLLPKVRGIVVSNAKPELLKTIKDSNFINNQYYFRATQPHAIGLIQGLLFFNVFSKSLIFNNLENPIEFLRVIRKRSISTKEIQGRIAEYTSLRDEIKHYDQTCLRILAFASTATFAVYGIIGNIQFINFNGKTVLNDAHEVAFVSCILILLISILWDISYQYMLEKRFQISKIAFFLKTEVENEEIGLKWESWLQEHQKFLSVIYFRRPPYILETHLTRLILLLNLLSITGVGVVFFEKSTFHGYLILLIFGLLALGIFIGNFFKGRNSLRRMKKGKRSLTIKSILS